MTANTVWYNLEETLTRLDLIDADVSIKPPYLQMYLTKHWPDLLHWEFGDDVAQEDENNQEQLDALNHLDLANVEFKFYYTLLRLFK